MGLDIGDARIGLALSDPTGIIAQPWKTVPNTGRTTIKQILALALEESVDTFVFGMPLELDGAHGVQAKKVESFSSQFSKLLAKHPVLAEAKILFWDERFSSAEADHLLVGTKLKNDKRSGARDRISAAIILEGYLGSQQSR